MKNVDNFHNCFRSNDLMQSTHSYFIIDLVCVIFNIVQTAAKEASILFVLAILNQLDTSYNLRGENLD